MKQSILCLTLLLGLLAPVRADDAANLDQQIATIDQTDATSAQPGRALSQVARKTGVPEARLKEQQTKTGLNPGGLFIANTLAAKTGRSFDEIVAEKNSGKGWGRIARDSNVKLGPLISESRKLEREQRAAIKANGKAPKGPPADRSAGKPEGAGKPADAGKPEPKGNGNAGGRR